MPRTNKETTLTSVQLISLMERINLLRIKPQQLIWSESVIERQFKHSLIHPCTHSGLVLRGIKFDISCQNADTCRRCIFSDHANSMNSVAWKRCIANDMQKLSRLNPSKEDIELSDLLELFYNNEEEFDNFIQELKLFADGISSGKYNMGWNINK